MYHLVNEANKISDAFRNSEKYIKYQEVLANIKTEEELKQKINAYKHMQIRYQTKLINNEKIDIEEEKNISKAYNELVLNEQCREYIMLENELLIILNDIYKAIGDDIKIAIEL